MFDHAAGDAVASYNALRAFSWQLRLSPFTLEDWCAALVAPHPTPLADEVHVSLLRLLAQDESKVRLVLASLTFMTENLTRLTNCEN